MIADARLLREVVDLVRSLLPDASVELPPKWPGRSDADFEALLRRHQIAGFLSARLEEAPELRSLGAGGVRAIEVRISSQRLLIEQCLRELEKVTRSFDTADVQFLLLKGIGFAARYYAALHHRSFWDLDILVRAEHADRAEERLASLGYTRANAGPVSRRSQLRFDHAVDLVKDGFKLDLHWALARDPSFELAPEGLFERAEPIEIEGVRARVPCDEDVLALRLVSAFGDIQRHSLRLRSLLDIAAVLERAPSEFDAREFFERRRLDGSERICASVLLLTIRVLDREGRYPELEEQALAILPLRSTGDEMLALLLPSRIGLRGKWWAARVRGGGAVRWFFWWLRSLPWRVMLHDPHFGSRGAQGKVK